MKHALFLSWSSIAARPLTALLSALSAACGIALLCAVFLLGSAVEGGVTRNARNIDMVVGAKGSPLQLVLSSVYHADIPAGNIEMRDAEKVSRNPRVKRSVPIAIGDNYKGWRVVGTTADYLSLYEMNVSAGRVFEKPFEVVAGAATGLAIGDVFSAAHGFSADSDDVHDAMRYTVVGVLNRSGTVADKLLLTPFESVQQLHAAHESHEGHGDHSGHQESAEEEAAEEALAHQVTALLIEVRSPLDVMTLPRQINTTTGLLAASPSYEMTRFSGNLGMGRDFVLILSILVVALSVLMLFSSLAAGLASRQYDLAILRVMGASRGILFLTVLLEGALIGLAGAATGVIAGHIAAYLTAVNITTLQGFVVPQSLLVPGVQDVYFVLMGIVAGCLAAFVPAYSAARMDIANLLAKGSA